MSSSNTSKKIVTRIREKVTEDVQSRADFREVPIERVGICDLKIPLNIKGCEIDNSNVQTVQAKLNLGVDLEATQKGIHMSRLIETALDQQTEFSLEMMTDFLRDLSERQSAKKSFVKIEFDYFFTKVAPVSGISSPQSYKCTIESVLNDKFIELIQSVDVPVKTLCPCSKEISDYGAHNQRSMVTISVTNKIDQNNGKTGISFEELIQIAENGASSPLYPILKREDERHITMNAYNNPCFVEDVVRNIATQLRNEERIDYYEIGVVNFESIHNHNAFALIEKKEVKKN